MTDPASIDPAERETLRKLIHELAYEMSRQDVDIALSEGTPSRASIEYAKNTSRRFDEALSHLAALSSSPQ